MPRKSTGKSVTAKKTVKEVQSNKENTAKTTEPTQRSGRTRAASGNTSGKPKNPREMPGVRSDKWRPEGQAQAGVPGVPTVNENPPTNVEGAATRQGKGARREKYQPPLKKNTTGRQLDPHAEMEEAFRKADNDNDNDIPFGWDDVNWQNSPVQRSPVQTSVESEDEGEKSGDDTERNVQRTPVSKRLKALIQTTPKRSGKKNKPESPTTPTGRLRWTPEMEARLIEMWRDETHMYDATSKGYRNTRLRQDCLERFAADLDIRAYDVDRHMQSMRTVYTKAVNPSSGSTPDDLTQRQLELRDTMSFLRDHVQKRPTISSIPKRNKNVKPQTIYTAAAAKMVKAGETPMRIGQERGPTPTPGTSAEAGDGYMPMDTHSENNDDITELPDETRKATKKRNAAEKEADSAPRYDPSKFKNKKPKTQQQADMRSQFLESISESLSSMANFVTPPPEEPTVEDYDLTWAKLLVPKMKEMSPRVKQKFQLHVDSLAVDAMNDEWP